MKNYLIILAFAIVSFFTSCQKEELSAGMQPINLVHIKNDVIYEDGHLDSIVAVAASYGVTAIVAWDTVFNHQISQSLSVYHGKKMFARFFPDSYDGKTPGRWHPDNLTLSVGAFDGGVLIDLRYSNHVLLSAVAKTMFVTTSRNVEFHLPLWSHAAGNTEEGVIQFRTFEGEWISKEY